MEPIIGFWFLYLGTEQPGNPPAPKGLCSKHSLTHLVKLLDGGPFDNGGKTLLVTSRDFCIQHGALFVRHSAKGCKTWLTPGR